MRRRAGLAAGLQHAIDHEGLDGVDAFGGDCHPEPRVVLEPEPFGTISITSASSSSEKSMLIDRHARPHEVCSFTPRVGCTIDERNEYSRVERSQPAPDGQLQRDAVHLDPRPIHTL